VLLAVVDAVFRFLWVNVGAEGSCSDAGIFNRSSLAPALQEGTLGLPEPDHLPHDDVDIPFFLVGDNAFALSTDSPKKKGSSTIGHRGREGCPRMLSV